MRLWTLHPKYLDSKGLVALWREGLLAKKVLEGQTRGYRNHPQLVRFRQQTNPLASLCQYLHAVLDEANRRGYHFDAGKLPPLTPATLIEETRGQHAYEWQHLLNKLKLRDPERFEQCQQLDSPQPHPLFRLIDGPVRDWEKR